MQLIAWGCQSDYMQPRLEQQKALYYFFTFVVVLPKHTLMCKIVGVTLWHQVLWHLSSTGFMTDTTFVIYIYLWGVIGSAFNVILFSNLLSNPVLAAELISHPLFGCKKNKKTMKHNYVRELYCKTPNERFIHLSAAFSLYRTTIQLSGSGFSAWHQCCREHFLQQRLYFQTC